uniref:Opsin, ultraviolet-sensitive n=1 Tax=Cacopsylla melanoneura TaxID=428564 RepID=A0A8D8SKY0_9HEMI
MLNWKLIDMEPINQTVIPPINGTNLTVPWLQDTLYINETEDKLLETFRRMYPVETWKEKGWFTDDYLSLINRHWLQFEPPSSSSHYILASCYFLIMVIGCSGNVLVIVMYLRCRSLQTRANMLILNLAISDLCLLAKTPVFIYNSLYFGPMTGKLGCEIYGFVGGLTGTVSITTLASIALERYYAVVYPLDPLKTTSSRSRLWIIFLWLYGTLFASLPLFSSKFNRYVPEGFLTSCSFDYLAHDLWSKGFILAFFCAAWVIPFIVITFSYVRICMIVIKSGMSTSRHAAQKKKKNIEVRLCVVAAGVIGLWFISWTPYATIALMGIFDFHRYITPTSSMIPALLCKAASCIDPYIYAITHPRFKRELIKMFCYNKKKDLAHTMYYEQPVWRTRTSRYNRTEAGWSYASSDADAGHGLTTADVEQHGPKRPSSYYSSRYSDQSSSDHRISRDLGSSSSSRGEYHCVNNVSKLPPKPEPEIKKVKKSRFCWKKKRKISEPMTSRVAYSECEVKSMTQDISREVETA